MGGVRAVGMDYMCGTGVLPHRLPHVPHLQRRDTLLVVHRPAAYRLGRGHGHRASVPCSGTACSAFASDAAQCGRYRGVGAVSDSGDVDGAGHGQDRV